MPPASLLDRRSIVLVCGNITACAKLVLGTSTTDAPRWENPNAGVQGHLKAHFENGVQGSITISTDMAVK